MSPMDQARSPYLAIAKEGGDIDAHTRALTNVFLFHVFSLFSDLVPGESVRGSRQDLRREARPRVADRGPRLCVGCGK